MTTATITAYYAFGHCFAFFADALDRWETINDAVTAAQAKHDNELNPKNSGWCRAFQMELTVDPERSVESIGEQVFRMTNMEENWQLYADFFNEHKSCYNARSLSVGDVLEVCVDGKTIFIGVDSVGFRTVQVA